MHVLALCDYSFSFNCVVCCSHLSTLIIDSNKKINFSGPKIVDADNEFDEDSDNKVICVKFWQGLEQNMIAKGISKKVSSMKVPRYKRWAPNGEIVYS